VSTLIGEFVEINDDLVSYFCQHLVPISFSMSRGDEKQDFIISSFVMSFRESWCLITAGHCIKMISELLSQGYKINSCVLIDSLGKKAIDKQGIPFVYPSPTNVLFSDDFAFDYGIIPLSKYYQELLKLNGIQAFDEYAWKKQPNDFEAYLLIGVPAEYVVYRNDSIFINPVMFWVEGLASKPDGFSDVDTPLFYGRIGFDADITSIKGMSGGPILGFKKDIEGNLRYWVIGVQSLWLPESHYIAACPTSILGFVMDNFVPNHNE
jgi:hypothetical protein